VTTDIETAVNAHLDHAAYAALQAGQPLTLASATELLVAQAWASLPAACERCGNADLLIERRGKELWGRRCVCERGRHLAALDDAVHAAQMRLRASPGRDRRPNEVCHDAQPDYDPRDRCSTAISAETAALPPPCPACEGCDVKIEHNGKDLFWRRCGCERGQHLTRIDDAIRAANKSRWERRQRGRKAA
jgi:hypothetical protein